MLLFAAMEEGYSASAYRAAYCGLFLGYTATDKNIRFGP